MLRWLKKLWRKLTGDEAVDKWIEKQKAFKASPEFQTWKDKQ